MNRYKTEYTILSWYSLEELSRQLNEMVNSPLQWRVDSHKLSGAGKDDLGWTIYIRSWDEAPPMTNFEISAGIVWNAMNSTEMYNLVGDYDDPRRTGLDLITEKIKEQYHKQYPNSDEILYGKMK